MKNLCKVLECDREAKTKGYCLKHYQRIWKNGTLEITRERNNNPPKFCTIDGCREKHFAKGHCRKHYMQSEPRKEQQKEYHQRNKQKRNLQNKEYYKEHRKELVDYARNYRKENPEATTKYREENKELLRKKSKAFHRKHNERDKRWSEKLIIKALYIYEMKCQICSCNDLVVLQWHSKDKSKKHTTMNLIREVVQAGKVLDHILLVCSNCHIHQDLEDETNVRGQRMKRISEKIRNEVNIEETA